MFLWSESHRNRLTAAVCVAALVSGCALQRFVRVEERRIDEHLWLFLGGGGNSAVITHGREAFVSDVKFGGAARALRHRVEEDVAREVRRVLLTHSHGDHAQGLSRFRRVGPVLVHPNTRRRLEAEGHRARWVEVEAPVRLVLGDEVVRVWHPGRGHTDGDLVAWLERRKLLITGDLVTADNEPLIDVEAGGDVLAFRDTLDALLEVDFVTALPGHGAPVGRQTLQRLRELFDVVEREVRAAQALGLSEDEVVARVSLASAPTLEPVPFAASRERTIRLMDRALRARAAPHAR
ncbi:MAG: MBL fold metallo-hydrolase [Myxococcaceae bacterium]|jgi:cyclase|nr:MBL fold metallo-hydrolase [Myxococcaceae bacterium]MCA3014424.1 MBL fold metallo-hydrolase [Myxococcaceae bacterium]